MRCPFWDRIAFHYLSFSLFSTDWVLDDVVKDRMSPTNWFAVCPYWQDIQPWNCSKWATQSFVDELTFILPGYIDMSFDCTNFPTESPTVSPAPTADTITECTTRQHFVYLDDDSADEGTEPYYSSNTLTSTFVNFPPYAYDEIHGADVVIFESGHQISEISSNPCDSSTWLFGESDYNDKVVMIYYNSSVVDWCPVQQWTLNLEAYANVLALLVVSEEEGDYVTELSGNSDWNLDLDPPSIPTRVISQYAASQIVSTHDPMVTIGCFENTEYPPQICLIDTSEDGMHVHLDGEYQEIARYKFNDHPMWVKWGMDGVWPNLFMVLYVNGSVDGEPTDGVPSWNWMIIDVDLNVYAECLVEGEHPDHPAECGDNWHVMGQPEETLLADNETCKLTDNYVCVESTPHSS